MILSQHKKEKNRQADFANQGTLKKKLYVSLLSFEEKETIFRKFQRPLNGILFKDIGQNLFQNKVFHFVK